MLQKLVRIASAEQRVRRERIVSLLEEIDYPFARYWTPAGRLHPENISVRFGYRRPRLVVCAHYDSVQGSTGANDNASGVCVLLELIQHYSQQPPRGAVEFVFFDLEEREFAGSWAYTQHLEAGEVQAAINLDLCGVGDTLLIGPREHAEQGVMAAAVQTADRLLGYPRHFIEGVLPGDHMAFEHVRIPAIWVSIVPHDDVPLLNAAAQQRVDLPQPSVFETMHNGPRDSIEVVREASLNIAFRWVDAVIQHFTEP